VDGGAVSGSPLREWLEIIGIYQLHEFLHFMRWLRGALVEARVAEYPSFKPGPIRNDFLCGLN